MDTTQVDATLVIQALREQLSQAHYELAITKAQCEALKRVENDHD